MELVLISFLVLLLIVLIFLLPNAGARQARSEQEQTMADMQALSDEARQGIRLLHRAYRTELTRAARAHAARSGRTL